MKFSTCYPDANSFKHLIKIKSLDDWKTEYVPLSDTAGYWIADNPFYGDGFELFKNLVGTFPLVSSNNDEYCEDPNPFGTIHIPKWAEKALGELVKQFYLSNINGFVTQSGTSEWGNVYREDAKPLQRYQLPHIDYQHGMIGNLWFTEHTAGTTGTNLYEYTGKMVFGNDGEKDGYFYDFQVDKTHPLYNEYYKMPRHYRLSQWVNFTDKEAEHWGFKKLGMAPCVYGKMTLYRANIPHCPYIEDSVKFRWSHAFAFYHQENTLGNLRNFL